MKLARKIIAGTFLSITAIVAVIVLWASINVSVKSDGALTFELACPQGSGSLPQFQTYNSITNQWRANVCVFVQNGYMVFQNNANGPIDAQLYCSLAGSPTDDAARIQACLTAYAGRELRFPKIKAATSGGGGTTNCDYVSSAQLTVSGNATRITGIGSARWSGGTCISFPTGIAGLYVPPTTYGVEIDHLELQGGDCAPGAAGTHDGILLRGGSPYVHEVSISCFDRHGIYIDGSALGGGQPDLWNITNATLGNNRANGLLVDGQDANAGVGTAINARSNAAIGIEDSSTLGNTYIQPHTTANNQPYKMIGASQSGSIVNGYAEAGQPVKSQFGPHWFVMGGDHGTPIDYSFSSPTIDTVTGGGVGSGTRNYLEVWNQQDAQGNIMLRSGATADATTEVTWRTFAAVSKYGIRKDAANNWDFWDYANNTYRIRIAQTANDNVYIRGVGTGEVSLAYNDGTGGVAFYGGTGTVKARVGADGGYAFTGITFASLGTPSNGKIIYCSDCTIANPCAGGGNGAIAKRLNGIWVCN